jgi:hypothetical protein
LQNHLNGVVFCFIGLVKSLLVAKISSKQIALCAVESDISAGVSLPGFTDNVLATIYCKNQRMIINSL